MFKKSPILAGTLMLTAAGFISKIIGFFYRIYLSRMLGSEGMGLYHLIFPVFGVCFSLCCGGMQTALSKFIAGEMASGRKKVSQMYFNCALLISTALALGCSAVLFNFSNEIAVSILHEERCAELLRILSLCIPFSSIHACVHGYYYGIHKASVPAFSQLAEQFIRVISVMIMVSVLASKNSSMTVAHSVYGLLAGEFAATLYSLTSYAVDKAKGTKLLAAASAKQPAATYSDVFRNLINLFLPLTGTRLIISILQSCESIMVPVMLVSFGLLRSDALSIYGVLTGMSLPFILFPTAITNSMAVMLLPAISQADASDDSLKIDRTIEATMSVSLYMGFLFAGLFISFGQSIGTIIYANESAGAFIVILAWLCPFLYVSTTMSSTINGLGKPKVSFINTASSLALRIAFVILIIPRAGIKAYLYGILASEMLLTILHYIYIKKRTGFVINPIRHLFKPMISMAGATITARIFTEFFVSALPVNSILKLVFSCGWFGLFYLLCAYAFNIRILSKAKAR